MCILIHVLMAAAVLACTRPSRPDAVDEAVTSSRDNGPGGRAARLQATLTELARGDDGTIAVTVMHLPSGAVASVNGDKRLPMMSVFKLPLAIVTLADVDAGTRKMDDRIPITSDEIRSFVSPVADAWKMGEKAPTLETILRTVIQDSDNTSGDKLVTMNGGGPAITARLRAMGIDGVDVAEEEIDIDARIECAGTPRPKQGWSEDAMAHCSKAGPPARAAAAKAETDASGNGATTNALVAMLAKLDRGDVLSPATRGWLMTTLQGTRTGPGRLRAGLPSGVSLAHKTGSGPTIEGMAIATNDIGIISLPDGTRLAIAVLTAGRHADATAREATIANAARAAWRAFAE